MHPNQGEVNEFEHERQILTGVTILRQNEFEESSQGWIHFM